jgi:uncharacterized membrane protein YfcA
MIILMIFSGITYLLHRFFKNRYIKYIPAMLALLLGIYNFYGAKFMPSEGFQDLARVILGVMMMAGFLSGIAAGVVIDYLLPMRRRKRAGRNGL